VCGVCELGAIQEFAIYWASGVRWPLNDVRGQVTSTLLRASEVHGTNLSLATKLCYVDWAGTFSSNDIWAQASRILANLIVAGGSVIVRAAATAWRQAVVSKLQTKAEKTQLLLLLVLQLMLLLHADGQRSGITPESLKNAATASKQMNLEEAYKILGADSKVGIEEVMKVSRQNASIMLHVMFTTQSESCSIALWLSCTQMQGFDCALCTKMCMYSNCACVLLNHKHCDLAAQRFALTLLVVV